MDDVFQDTKTRRLPVVLSEEEVNVFAHQNAQQVQALLNAKDLKKAEMAEHNATIKELDAEVKRLTDIVNTGVEWRQVIVYETLDRKAGMVRIYRQDTEELVDTRQMTDEEKQGRLRMDED